MCVRGVLAGGLILMSSAQLLPLPKSTSKAPPPRKVEAARVSAASGEAEEISAVETLAKQLASSELPSVAHQLGVMARQSKNPQTSALAAFAVGYYEFGQDNFQHAAEFFNNPHLADSEVADYAALYLARSRHQLLQYSEALTALENFPQRFPTSILASDAIAEQCRILMDSGAPARCVQLLQAQPNFLSTPQFLLIAAQAQELNSQWEQEGRWLTRIAYAFPFSAEALEAKGDLQDLQRHHPSAAPRPDAAIIRSRAEAYFRQKRYADALADFRALERNLSSTAHALSASEESLVLLHRGECLFHLARLREASAALRRVTPVSGEMQAEKIFYDIELGRKLSPGSPDELEQPVEEMKKNFPSSPWTEAAIFSLANYFLVHQDRPRATALYREMVESFPQGKNAPEALFRVAWSAYLRRNYGEATTLFRRFLDLYPENSRSVSAVYWLGRIAETSSADAAAAYYRTVIRDFGESYYAQSARLRLSKLHLKSESAAPAVSLPDLRSSVSLQDETPHDASTQACLRRAAFFNRASISDLAISELRVVMTRGRSIRAMSELARLYLQQQNYGAAMVTVRRVFPDYFRTHFDRLPVEYWKALFPLPYWSIIRREAERQGVDPFLVASLIRQESAFNLNARSHAHALGLMQLLPRVARRYARKERVAHWRYRKIFDPAINIRLGVAYLADTLKRYNGSVELTLAAYNAGDNRVSAWLEEKSMAAISEDPMEFVESIPFTETREYVQILFRNLGYYKKIYGASGD